MADFTISPIVRDGRVADFTVLHETPDAIAAGIAPPVEIAGFHLGKHARHDPADRFGAVLSVHDLLHNQRPIQ